MPARGLRQVKVCRDQVHVIHYRDFTAQATSATVYVSFARSAASLSYSGPSRITVKTSVLTEPRD